MWECGRRFFTRDKLTRHKRNVHGANVYCTIPGCKFSTRKSKAYKLKDHLKTHHRSHSPHQQTTGTQKTHPKEDTHYEKAPEQQTYSNSPHLHVSNLNLEGPASTWESPKVNLSDFMGLDNSPYLSNSVGFSDLLRDIDIPLNLTASTNEKPTTHTALHTTIETQTILDTTDTAAQTITTTKDNTTQTHHTTPSIPKPVTPEHFSIDPLCYFAGAPSAYMEGFTASVLRDLKDKSRMLRDNYKRRWAPEALLCISKVETAILPDGTIYTLKDCWVRPPTSSKHTSTATQTTDKDELQDTHSTQDTNTPQDIPLNISIRRIEE